MKSFELIITAFLVMSCSFKYSQENHTSTSMISDGLFIEVFLVDKGGAYASNSYSYYVTDSLNFRTYLYTKTDDSYGIDAELRGNDLYVYKTNPKEKIEVNKINIQEAKQKGVFE